MTTFEIVCGVMATCMSTGCLGIAIWSVWYGLGPGKSEEIQPFYLFAPLVMVPVAVLFGYYGHAEAWVFAGACVCIIGFLCWLRYYFNVRRKS